MSLNIDLLNILLMFVSLVLAIYFPFELFILGYAILGPLHYVTEMNWLEKKSFFLQQKKWVWLFIMIAIIVVVPIVLFKLNSLLEGGARIVWLTNLRSYAVSLGFSALITAVILTLTKKWWLILAVFVSSFIFGELLVQYSLYTLLVGVLLPSLVHVFVFTFFFILYGAMKSKSKLGFTAAFLLLILPVFIMYIPVDVKAFQITEYFKQSFTQSSFADLNYGIARLLGAHGEMGEYYLISEMGLKIQMFIAFTYTYHYLNWFSKTTVIGWHKFVSRKKMILILSIWFVSMVIYYFNYLTGFLILLFLSYLHVLLEFPLNVTSIRGVVKGIFRRF